MVGKDKERLYGQLDRMESKQDAMQDKLDKLIEISAKNSEAIKGQQRQLTGVWGIIAACAAWLIRKAVNPLL